MHDIINFLKDAVERGPTLGLQGCYIIAEGQISASNQLLQAGLPFASDTSFNIPATPLDEALARMRKIDELVITGGAVKIKAGRLSATVKCIDGPMQPLPDRYKNWLPCPATFVEALKLAVPFLGDRGWSEGIRLSAGRVTALSNTSGIDINVPRLVMASYEILLPRATANYLISAGNPNEYVIEDDLNAVMFRWDDGRWIRSKVIDDKMPGTIDGLFEKHKAETTPSIKVSAEFRTAYEDAAALSDGTVWLSPDGWRSQKADLDTVVRMDVPVHSVSWWGTKVLSPVIEVADFFDPDKWPDPCPFSGGNFRGIVCGVQARG